MFVCVALKENECAFFALDLWQEARNPGDDPMDPSAGEMQVTKSQKSKFGILVPSFSATASTATSHELSVQKS
jgi:hypothetical protein